MEKQDKYYEIVSEKKSWVEKEILSSSRSILEILSDYTWEEFLKTSVIEITKEDFDKHTQ